MHYRHIKYPEGVPFRQGDEDEDAQSGWPLPPPPPSTPLPGSALDHCRVSSPPLYPHNALGGLRARQPACVEGAPIGSPRGAYASRCMTPSVQAQTQGYYYFSELDEEGDGPLPLFSGWGHGAHDAPATQPQPRAPKKPITSCSRRKPTSSSSGDGTDGFCPDEDGADSLSQRTMERLVALQMDDDDLRPLPHDESSRPILQGAFASMTLQTSPASKRLAFEDDDDDECCEVVGGGRPLRHRKGRRVVRQRSAEAVADAPRSVGRPTTSIFVVPATDENTEVLEPSIGTCASGGLALANDAALFGGVSPASRSPPRWRRRLHD